MCNLLCVPGVGVPAVIFMLARMREAHKCCRSPGADVRRAKSNRRILGGETAGSGSSIDERDFGTNYRSRDKSNVSDIMERGRSIGSGFSRAMRGCGPAAEKTELLRGVAWRGAGAGEVEEFDSFSKNDYNSCRAERG